MDAEAPAAPSVTVGDARIPAIGLGTWDLRRETCTRIVAEALKIGYRHIDTAQGYENETQDGEGIRASGIARDQVVFLPNRVRIGNQEISFNELVRQAFVARVQLSAAGFYKTPKIHWDRAKGRGHAFYYFAYGAACSEVSVDMLTGDADGIMEADTFVFSPNSGGALIFDFQHGLDKIALSGFGPDALGSDGHLAWGNGVISHGLSLDDRFYYNTEAHTLYQIETRSGSEGVVILSAVDVATLFGDDVARLTTNDLMFI